MLKHQMNLHNRSILKRGHIFGEEYRRQEIRYIKQADKKTGYVEV
jgi:hypothetical protein